MNTFLMRKHLFHKESNKQQEQNLKAFLMMLLKIKMKNICLKQFLSLSEKKINNFKQMFCFLGASYHQIRLNSNHRSSWFKNHGALRYLSFFLELV